MAFTSIGGVGRPIFNIYTKDGNKVDTIEFTLCGEEGLVEDYEIFTTEHELYNYTTESETEGYHITYYLSYSEFSSNPTTTKVGKLMQYILTNKVIEIIPRHDVDIVKYIVFLKDKIIQKGNVNGGNRLITLVFKTKYLQKDIKWYDPTNLYIAIDFDDFTKA